MWDNQLTNLLNRAEQGIESRAVAGGSRGLRTRTTSGRSIFGSNSDGRVCNPTTCNSFAAVRWLSLDAPLGEPAAIYAAGRLIGRGEIVVTNGKIGVRVMELVESRLLAVSQ